MALLSHYYIAFASYLSLCSSLVVDFDIALVADCEVVFHLCVDTIGLSSCPICQFVTLTNTYLLSLPSIWLVVDTGFPLEVA